MIHVLFTKVTNANYELESTNVLHIKWHRHYETRATYFGVHYIKFKSCASIGATWCKPFVLYMQQPLQLHNAYLCGCLRSTWVRPPSLAGFGSRCLRLIPLVNPKSKQSPFCRNTSEHWVTACLLGAVGVAKQWCSPTLCHLRFWDCWPSHTHCNCCAHTTYITSTALESLQPHRSESSYSHLPKAS